MNVSTSPVQPIGRMSQATGSAGHVVQFYESDQYLIDNVCHFAAAGLAENNPVLVIATPAHRMAFRERLQRDGFDLDAARTSGLYTECDANELMSEFMVGGQPDPVRFRERVGSLIASTQARRPGGRLRAFGEMVDLLWWHGNSGGAVRLEELWNALAESHAFSLMCAYAMRSFETSWDSAEFAALCNVHAQLIPTEGYEETGHDDAPLNELAFLQRQASTLTREIARWREREQALREALARATEACARAERMVRYNERFAGTVGHDLRNPLNTILTTAQYLERTCHDARTGAAVARIAASSRRMARMIEQLLAFTRLRLGESTSVRRTRLDLADLCAGIRAEMQVDRPGCIIETDARGASLCELDYDQMLDVLSNLMSNAVDHGTPGSVVRVEIDGTHPAQLFLRIHNSGAVAAEVLPVLFEPFRGEAKGRRSQALGLGLYITRQIVVAHGGQIEVESNDADGTTFRIALPRSGAWDNN